MARARRRVERLLLAALMTTLGTVAPANAAPAGFTVAGGPEGPLALTPGAPNGGAYTVANASENSEDIVVAITGLHFNGDAPQFTGQPSPGLTVTATPGQLHLAPGASRSVQVTVTAAADARPGGLYAGVVFREVPQNGTNDSTIAPAQARPLIGHVPGTVDDNGRITALTGDPNPSAEQFRVQLHFLDTGTIDYPLHVSVLLRHPDGTIETADAQPATVLPGNERAVPITFNGHHSNGRYKADATATWGTTGEHHGDAAATIDLRVSPGRTPSQEPHGSSIQTIIINRSPSWRRPLFIALSILALLLVIAMLLSRYLRNRHEAHRVRA